LGTNDVFATLSNENTKRYIRLEKLPQKPTIEWYIENMGKIINHLKTNTSAKIAIITLPIIGEDLNNFANRTVEKYNSEIKNLSKQYELGCLDMNQKMIEFLDQPHPMNLVSLQNYRSLILKSIWRKYFLFQDWNTISLKNGLILTTDSLHLNITSGKMLANLVKNYIFR
jgi:lysophospholipase L1-like esterase